MNTTDNRLNMRISADNRELLRDAAAAQGQDLTSFVLGAALDRARAVIIQDSFTRLTRDESADLNGALAREPESIPAVTELLRLASDSTQSRRAERNRAARTTLAALHEDTTDRERDLIRTAMDDLFDENGLPA